MAIVTVKNKYQVVIPKRIRAEIGVNIGDVFEAKAHKGKIVLEPKSIVDRRIAEGLADIKAGRVHGPYNTVDEAMAAMKEQMKPPGAKSRRARRSR